MKKWSLLLLLVLSCACSSRQVSDHYTGATEQRLIAHSINDLMEKLPEKDFSELQGKKVFLECFFLNNIEPLAYSKERFRLELMDTWGCRMVPEKTDADMTVQVFFTAIGTDTD